MMIQNIFIYFFFFFKLPFNYCLYIATYFEFVAVVGNAFDGKNVIIGIIMFRTIYTYMKGSEQK